MCLGITLEEYPVWCEAYTIGYREMSENILQRNCESCAITLTTLDLRQEPDLILCEL